ncbi:MAG: glycosyltransferase family 4 protein [Candidatus Poseidoniaceae archaeon]|nr:glycosyltransferase family 4 protein [Candidatus Poseidoniaceae archaeon]
MHIAMIAGEYPPRWGGIVSVVFHLAGHLASFGHEVTIITRSHNGIAPAQSGVSIVEVPWLKLPMKFTRSYAKNALKVLKRLHQAEPFDVIHVHLPLASFTSKEFKFMEQNIAPVCCSLHGSWLGEKQGVIRAAKAGESATWLNPNDLAIRLTAKWYSRYEKAGLLNTSISVANSQSTLKEFAEWYAPEKQYNAKVILWGCDHKVFRPANMDDEEEQLAHEKIRHQYNCDDEKALSHKSSTDTPMLLAVGRLVARKGYMTLLRAMPNILAKHPDAKLVIIGRGHMKSKLMKEAKKLSISDSVFIESGMSFDDLAQHFRSADLVVYPSYYEGQGLIPLESMSSGTPVVTVDMAPLTEMVDDTVGGLFESGNSQDLAKTVNNMLSDAQGRSMKAEAGRKLVLSKYTYEHNANDFLQIYQSILNNHSKSS